MPTTSQLDPLDYLYSMVGTDRAPMADGDTQSWFRFYKWQTEGEVYVPWSASLPERPLRGDRLWFALDGVLLGGAYILRVTESRGFSTGELIQELWYAPLDGVEAEAEVRLGHDMSACVPTAVAGTWLASCRPRVAVGSRAPNSSEPT